MGIFSSLFKFQFLKGASKKSYSNFIYSKNNTAWIFIAAGNSEARHIWDILWGVTVLKIKGIKDSQIFIFSDFAHMNKNLETFAITQNIFHAKYLKSEVQKIIDFDHLVMVVTGHGNHHGLPVSGSKLTPSDLVEAIRSCQNLKSGTLILGQCYAGVFNYLPASKEPEIVIMGATNLHSSLSSTINLNFPIHSPNSSYILNSWLANIFLFYIFEWFLNPIDIDGDGKYTLADLYKYAGVQSNQHLLSLKTKLAMTYDKWCIDAKKKIEDHESKAAVLTEIELKSIHEQLNNNLTNLYLHQEPWLLHANLARAININLNQK